MAESEVVQDLIIIKRAHAEHETPKGGVWKIAFADFMTAMMCFFLVMWLINAANEDTRQAVASYFNPVRLSDLNRKGLQDPHIAPDNKPEHGERTMEESTPGEAPEGKPNAAAREALFNDPYKVLAKLAKEGEKDTKTGDIGEKPAALAAAAGTPAGTTGAPPGMAAFRDPFDPNFQPYDQAGEVSQPGPQAAGVSGWPAAGAAPASDAATRGRGVAAAAGDAPGPVAEIPLEAPDGEGADAAPETAQSFARLAGSVAPQSHPSLPGDAAASDAPSAVRMALEAELNEAVARESGATHGPQVDVKESGGGYLISLTDDVDFGMFDVGSAEPNPETVRIMERIAGILRARPGSITIRGHTDARPYRSGNYDNWRLSTDRAQMAYYMLVRGGLDDHRVAGIEGYADRQLKVPADPDAAENRRIEILLQEART